MLTRLGISSSFYGSGGITSFTCTFDLFFGLRTILLTVFFFFPPTLGVCSELSVAVVRLLFRQKGALGESFVLGIVSNLRCGPPEDGLEPEF